MDGVDAVAVRFQPRPVLLATHEHPFPPVLAARLRQLLEGPSSPAEMGAVDARLGELFADAALAVMDAAGIPGEAVAAIGSHGQTVHHAPTAEAPFSCQLGDPNRIAWRTGRPVVADFRRMDVAAGGQGAPLVPPFHAAVFADAHEDRAVLNLGGIANLTLLPAGEPEGVRGFDTGPANTLLDAVARETGRPFDRDGALAAAGRVDEGLLAALLDDAYFAAPPPKSTGPERFNPDWVRARAPRMTPADLQATLVELTARTVATALRESAPGTARVLACGGGTHNPVLMDRLARCLEGIALEPTDAHGIGADWVEATAFAWLAGERLAGRPGNLPAVTGAARAVRLGGIYRP